VNKDKAQAVVTSQLNKVEYTSINVLIVANRSPYHQHIHVYPASASSQE